MNWFFQGWEVGLAVSYTNQQGLSNVGLQAVVGKTTGLYPKPDSTDTPQQ